MAIQSQLTPQSSDTCRAVRDHISRGSEQGGEMFNTLVYEYTR